MGAADTPPDAQGIDARAEHAERRREGDDRADDSEGNCGDTRECEGAQEVLREEEHRREGHRDREAGEHDGSTGR